MGQGELQSFLVLAQELEISGLIEDPNLLNKHQTIHQIPSAVDNEMCTNIAATPEENPEINQKERELGKSVNYMSVKSENSEDKSILGMMHTNNSAPWNNPNGVRKEVKCNYCQKVVKTSTFLQKHILRRHRQEPKLKLQLEDDDEKEFISDIRKTKDIISLNNKTTDIDKLSDETDLKELIADAAVDIKYEIQENCNEKEEHLDPLAKDFAKE